MSEEKKIDLKDKMLSDDDLDQVSGGANEDYMAQLLQKAIEEKKTIDESLKKF